MFCCTTLRDVIFAEWYFVNVISTSGILKHAVVCRVTTIIKHPGLEKDKSDIERTFLLQDKV